MISGTYEGPRGRARTPLRNCAIAPAAPRSVGRPPEVCSGALDLDGADPTCRIAVGVERALSLIGAAPVGSVDLPPA